MSKKHHFIILKNELPEDHLLWVKALNNYSDTLTYSIVDLTRNDWLTCIREKPADMLLAKPGGVNGQLKQLYDERIYILERVLGYKVFPSAEEIFIYENKRFLSFWLMANNIPHPETFVCYNKDEAMAFLDSRSFPVVAKTNIGASGSGVVILKQLQQGKTYVQDAFSGKGASQRTGPNLEKGGLLKRGLFYFLNPEKIRNKLLLYQSRRSAIQKGFVIFQEFVPHNFEWRVVRIGDSFFAHKKLLMGEKASGSLLKGYENPPPDLFDFVRDITDKHHLYSQAVDIFETGEGYLVNEMQCIFGQSDPYQMLFNNEPGRYVFRSSEWVFEAGDFARNACYDLRLEFLIEQFAIKSDK
ncbi:MAG: hypothetical protein IH598_04705 [Bacteroidales bacterium]|nr:hypothetical protein [Bacteroidales bacterium]